MTLAALIDACDIVLIFRKQIPQWHLACGLESPRGSYSNMPLATLGHPREPVTLVLPSARLFSVSRTWQNWQSVLDQVSRRLDSLISGFSNQRCSQIHFLISSGHLPPRAGCPITRAACFVVVGHLQQARFFRTTPSDHCRPIGRPGGSKPQGS